MNNLTTFNFNNSELRVVELEGNPWFVAKDVCIAIGYNVKNNGEVNTTNALQYLDASEITTARISSKGNPPKLISESGLYKLIMRSDKPQAKPFQDWFTKVVLPAIRKDGGYIVGEENTDDDDLLMARALQVAQRAVLQLMPNQAYYSSPLVN